MNGYPRELVIKNWKPTARPHRPEVSDTPKVKVILPYVQHLSETIRRILTPLGIYTCFRPHHTLHRTLVHLKDPTPLRQRTGVVYRISCSNEWTGTEAHYQRSTILNPPSAPALLRTCCCLHIIQQFFFLIFPLIILYTYHALHSPTLIQYMHACVLSHITFWWHHQYPRQK